MKKMNESAQRKINGGTLYACTSGGAYGGRSDGFITAFKFRLGYHYLFCHYGLYKAGKCTCRVIK